jgi:hypothetical protein
MYIGLHRSVPYRIYLQLIFRKPECFFFFRVTVSGHCLLSGILRIGRRDVSETGSVSILERVGETPFLFGAVGVANLSRPVIDINAF